VEWTIRFQSDAGPSVAWYLWSTDDKDEQMTTTEISNPAADRGRRAFANSFTAAVVPHDKEPHA
jgi:hypothetical protein